jgi:isopenicillin-N epimerase
MERNHRLCLEGRDILCEVLNLEPPCTNNMLASMATIPVPLPDHFTVPGYKETDPLQDRLFRDFNIEIPVIYWSTPARRFIRISAQLYNSVDQYRYLATYLPGCIPAG